MDKAKLIAFLNDQISQADFRARGYVFDEKNKERPQRNLFIKIKAYLDNFLERKSAVRWISLTGLRGAGKTTLLFQTFYERTSSDFYKLFLSVDQVVQLLGSSLHEVLSVYEELIGRPFEQLDKPLLLFLDEVQYDPKWGVALKSVYDRSAKVFIFATGSAALAMNQNTDVARRTILEKLFPLDFSEYLKICLDKHEPKDLAVKLRQILYESQDASSVYTGLKQIGPEVNSSLLGVTEHDITRYINYGSLPFMITLQNEALVYEQISKIIGRVINDDLALDGKLSSEVLSRVPRLLYALSGMDVINYSKLASDFGLSRPTITQIFDLLEHTETLTRVVPYGSSLSQAAKKPSKYLFSSPSFRAMYQKTAGSIVPIEEARGKLWEDLVGMYLTRYLYQKTNRLLAYDSAQGGADFILGFGHQKIVIEVGVGSKGYKQTYQTAQKVRPSYSLVISNDGLDYSEEFSAVKIPLRMFLLT